jgi:hypothetical protein
MFVTLLISQQAGGGGVSGLGKVWSHCVNTRLVLDCLNEREMAQICGALTREGDANPCRYGSHNKSVAPFKKMTIAKVYTAEACNCFVLRRLLFVCVIIIFIIIIIIIML